MAKAGLAKLNMNLAANSMKKAAASTLSNTQRSVGVSYGIKSIRSDQSIFNVKSHYSNSTSALRHELNRQVIVNNNIPARAPRDDGMSTMEKLMMYSMLGSAGVSFAKGIIDTVKDLKSTSSNKHTESKDGKNDVTSGMQNAKDATTLNNEIEKAKTKLNTTSTEISSKEAKLNELKGNTAELKTNSEKATKDLENHKNAIRDKESEINQQKQTVSACETSYNSAKVEYERCPDTIKTPNGDTIPNPKKAKLKEIMDDKKRKLDEAKTKLEELEQEKKQLESKTESYEKAAKDAKDAYEKNQNDIKDNEAKLKDLNAEKEQLDKEIPKQEKRLEKLQKKEKKQTNSAENNND